MRSVVKADGCSPAHADQRKEPDAESFRGLDISAFWAAITHWPNIDIAAAPFAMGTGVQLKLLQHNIA